MLVLLDITTSPFFPIHLLHLPHLSAFCLPTSLSRHKSCQRLASSLPVCLYSLFAAEEQSILFKETPEKWDICQSTHTITQRGIIIMDAHGLMRKRERRKGERDGCLLSSELPPLWLDRWMTSLCLCFLSLSLFLFLFSTWMENKDGQRDRGRVR